jgi:hypothetical protein
MFNKKAAQWSGLFVGVDVLTQAYALRKTMGMQAQNFCPHRRVIE